MPYYLTALLLVVVCLVLGQAMAVPAGQALTPAQIAKLGQVLRIEGYPCKQPTAGFYEGTVPQGMAFRILCETETFQVIIRPDDTFVVRTWVNRLP